MCQPFISRMEQEVLTNQGITTPLLIVLTFFYFLENKSISFRLSGHDYTTLLLPRLQMKLLEMQLFDFRLAASKY